MTAIVAHGSNTNWDGGFSTKLELASQRDSARLIDGDTMVNRATAYAGMALTPLGR